MRILCEWMQLTVAKLIDPEARAQTLMAFHHQYLWRTVSRHVDEARRHVLKYHGRIPAQAVQLPGSFAHFECCVFAGVTKDAVRISAGGIGVSRRCNLSGSLRCEPHARNNQRAAGQLAQKA